MRGSVEDGGGSAWGVGDTQGPGGCSPVSDLADLLPDLPAPVGDEEGHPRGRLTLRRGAQVTLQSPRPEGRTPAQTAPSPRLRTVTGSSSCCSVSRKLAMRNPRQALQSRRSRAAAFWGSTAPATKLRGQAGLGRGCAGAALTSPPLPSTSPAHPSQAHHPSLPRGRQEPTRHTPGREKPVWQTRIPGPREEKAGVSLREHWTRSLHWARKSAKLPLTYLTLRSWCGSPGAWSRGVLSEGPSVWVAAT